MNLGFVIKTALHGAGMFLKQHAPQILVYTGIAGFAGTVVLGCKATVKATDIIEEKNEQLETLDAMKEDGFDADGKRYSEEDYNHDKKELKKRFIWDMVKTYGLTASLGLASAASILWGHGELGKRFAGAAVACKALESQIKQAYENTENLVGEEQAKKIFSGEPVDVEKVKEYLDKPEEVKEQEKAQKKLGPDHEFTFFYNEANCCCYIQNFEKALCQIRRDKAHVQDRVRECGYADVNDALWYLGMSDCQTEEGSKYIWDNPEDVAFGIERFEDPAAVREACKKPFIGFVLTMDHVVPAETHLKAALKKNKKARNKMIEIYENRVALNGYSE